MKILFTFVGRLILSTLLIATSFAASNPLVRHVSPAQPDIRLLAAWMRSPVAGTPNNWAQVSKNQAGKYTAAVGMETIDVELKVSLENGTVLSATMDNPVEVLERECADAALAHCGDPVRYRVRRQIEIRKNVDHGPASASSLNYPSFKILTGEAVHHRHRPTGDAWICTAPRGQARFTPSRAPLALRRTPSPPASPAARSPRTPT